MAVLSRKRGLDAPSRAALAAALADPIFELLPLKNLPDQIPHLPAGARVSVTASPAKGIDATVDWAARLQADGFRAILGHPAFAGKAFLLEVPGLPTEAKPKGDGPDVENINRLKAIRDEVTK